MNRRWPFLLLIVFLAGGGAIYFKRHAFDRDSKPQLTGATHEDSRSDNPLGDNLGAANPDSSTHSTNLNPGPEPGKAPSTTTGPQPLDPAQSQDSARARLLAMYDTPINFYGRVVDESGRVVSGAKATISVHDKPWTESATRLEAFSDASGLFSLLNRRGVSLYVQVEKDNYYSGERAKMGFNYGGVKTTSDPELPTASNPAVFVLTAKGTPEPLAQMRRQSFRVAKDGTPLDIPLKTATEGTPNHIRIEAFTQDTTKNDRGRYDWRCRVTLRGGGLVPQDG